MLTVYSLFLFLVDVIFCRVFFSRGRSFELVAFVKELKKKETVTTRYRRVIHHFPSPVDINRCEYEVKKVLKDNFIQISQILLTLIGELEKLKRMQMAIFQITMAYFAASNYNYMGWIPQEKCKVDVKTTVLLFYKQNNFTWY